MKTYVPGWTTLAENPPLIVRDYAFGPGRANSVAVTLPSGKWLIMSPPNTISREEVDAFGGPDGVAALLENNGMHYLGLPVLRAAFPSAKSYASPRAAVRIRKKTREPGELASPATLQPLLGEHVRLSELAGDKVGDVLMHVRTERGPVLYAGDLFANLSELPSNLLFRLLFRWTGSAPGLRVFGMFFRFFVADAAEARRFLIRELEQTRPTLLVPAHGDVIAREELSSELIRLLQAHAGPRG